MEFILFIAVIVLFVYFHNRISKLEDLINNLNQTKILSEPVIKNYSESELSKKEDTPVVSVPVSENYEVSDPLSNFFKWFSKDWILKLGALFVLLGFIWLVSYAFINGWIDEQGRILLGLVCGACILIFGHFRIQKIKEQGVIFEVLGAGVMIVSVYSAQFFYKMFTAEIALFLILLTVLVTAVSSLIHNSKSLITLSILIAYVAPFLIGSDTPNFVLILWYVLVICFGSIWVTYFKNWRFLFVISSVFTFFYCFIGFGLNNIFSPYSGGYSPSDLLWFRFFALSFTSLLFFSSISLVAFTKKIEQTDYLSSTIVSFLVLFFVYSLVPDYLRSTFLVFGAVLFISASYYIFKLNLNENIIKSYTLASCVLLLFATFTEFSGATLLLILCLEAFVVPYVLTYVFNNKDGSYFVLFSIPVLFASVSVIQQEWLQTFVTYRYSSYSVIAPDIYSRPVDRSIFTLNMLSLFITIIYVIGISLFFIKKISFGENRFSLAKFYFVVLGVYIIIFNSLFLQLLFKNSNITSTLNIIIMSVIGLFLYFKGISKSSLYVKNYGMVLLFLVVIWLFGYEVWKMDNILYKILTFFGVGVVFILSVLIPKKFLKS